MSEAAEALVGLHASDPVTVYLAARARVADLGRDAVERALYDDRTVVRMLGMRRTMFVVTPEVAATMDAACTKALGPPQRRRLAGVIEQQAIADDGEAWIDRVSAAVLTALERRGEATATELTEDVPELGLKFTYGEGKEWGGQFGVSTRILFLLATEGRIVRGRPRGSWLSSLYAWASVDHWLGAGLPVLDAAIAQADLARRWLRSFGPGTMADLKWWTGWTVRDARRAIDAVGAVEVGMDGGTGYLLPDDLDPVEPTEPWVALLPSLDPTSMGWKERDWYFGPHADQLFDRNGNAGPTVWSDGRVVGGWGQHRDGEVVFELLEDVAPRVRRSIADEAEHLAAWLDGFVITPRFRTPLEIRLRT